MSGCSHGGSTNCEVCRKLAHITALAYSPQTLQHMQETLARLGPENIILKERIALLEAEVETCPNCGFTCNLSPRERRVYEARTALLEAAGNALLHQIDINDFQDSNGHDLKMLKAVHDLRALLKEDKPQ